MGEVDEYLDKLKERFSKIDPTRYYLAYSGGKDSHLLYWLIKDYLKIEGVTVMGIITRLEHKEIADRIRKNCDVVMMSKLEPMQIKELYGSPCFSKVQDEMIKRYQAGSRTDNTMKFIMGVNPIFKISKKARQLLLADKLPKISSNCCKYLKREPANRFIKETRLKPILGVRGDESKTRRAQYRGCFTKNGTFTPIWDLDDRLEKAIYDKYHIEIPKIYKYVERTGCMGCPYAKRCISDIGNIEKELLLANDELFVFACRYFEESYKVLGVDVSKIEQQRKERKVEDGLTTNGFSSDKNKKYNKIGGGKDG